MGDVYTTVHPKDYSMCCWCQGKHQCSLENSQGEPLQPWTLHGRVLLASEWYLEWLYGKGAEGLIFIGKFISKFYRSST